MDKLEFENIDDLARNVATTILVVDDEEPVRETTQAMLKVSGYSVEIAPDRIKAL